MTRRERLEAKVEKRQEWAEKAEDRSAVAFKRVDAICQLRPFGQPILVGHHSEKHARADQRRVEAGMDKGCAEHALAQHHINRAAGLAHQLEHNVYSDDQDAVEKLEARASENEAKAARMVDMNKAWRKSKGDAVTFASFAGIPETTAQVIAANIAKAYSWEKQPYPAYELSNLRARIRTDRERIEEIQARQQRTERAEANGGTLFEGTGDYVSVTFHQKPERSVLDALKAAGFWWSGGSWSGLRSRLPEDIEKAG